MLCAVQLQDFKIIAGDDFHFGFVFDIDGEIPKYVNDYKVTLLISRYGAVSENYTLPAVKPNENGECLLSIPSEITSVLNGNYMYQIQINTPVTKVTEFSCSEDGTNFSGIYDDIEVGSGKYIMTSGGVLDVTVVQSRETVRFSAEAPNKIRSVELYGIADDPVHAPLLARISLNYDENGKVIDYVTEQFIPDCKNPKQYLKFYGHLNVIPQCGV